MKSQSSNTHEKGTLLHEHTFPTSSEKSEIRFSAYVKKLRADILSPSGKKLSTRELASQLGIDYEHFRKILNMNKPTRRRDCIIAICAALRLDSEETNDALIMYQYMPTLDPLNPRDKFLIDILDRQLTNPLTINEINRRLFINEFPELDIIDHRPAVKPKLEDKNSLYKILKKQVQTFSDDLIFGDQYNSLDAEYSLHRYRCVAKMWIEHTATKAEYRLTADTNHNYYIEVHDKQTNDIKLLKAKEDYEDFKDFFPELDGLASRELKKMYTILNDTRNYQTRISAGIRNDTLHIYAETFNYTVPELNEYYLFEYQSGTPLFSVYRHSEFMRCYLQQDEYLSAYGSKPNTLIAKYYSLEELIAPKDPCLNEYLLNCRLRHFRRLKDLADSLLSDIRTKKRFIRHLDYIYEDRDRVCQYFGVDKEFQCVLDEEYGDMMIAKTDAVDFQFEDCGIVHITLEDLYKAFELGFNNIHEICRVKKNLGSLENILR